MNNDIPIIQKYDDDFMRDWNRAIHMYFRFHLEIAIPIDKEQTKNYLKDNEFRVTYTDYFVSRNPNALSTILQIKRDKGHASQAICMPILQDLLLEINPDDFKPLTPQEALGVHLLKEGQFEDFVRHYEEAKVAPEEKKSESSIDPTKPLSDSLIRATLLSGFGSRVASRGDALRLTDSEMDFLQFEMRLRNPERKGITDDEIAAFANGIVADSVFIGQLLPPEKPKHVTKVTFTSSSSVMSFDGDVKIHSSEQFPPIKTDKMKWDAEWDVKADITEGLEQLRKDLQVRGFPSRDLILTRPQVEYAKKVLEKEKGIRHTDQMVKEWVYSLFGGSVSIERIFIVEPYGMDIAESVHDMYTISALDTMRKQPAMPKIQFYGGKTNKSRRKDKAQKKARRVNRRK